MRTLLDGFSESTVSEWTFGVRRRSSIFALTALYTAARTWRFDTTWHIGAVSKLVQPGCQKKHHPPPSQAGGQTA